MPKSIVISLLASILFTGWAEAQSFREQAREAALRGDNAKAVTLYEKALSTAITVFKEGDLELTLRRAELGEAYRAVGRFQDAIIQLEYAWKRARHDATKNQLWLGQEGDLAMGCAEKLARSYQGIADYEKSIETLKTALDDNLYYHRRVNEAVQFRVLLTDMYLLLNRDEEAADVANEAMKTTDEAEKQDPVHAARVSSVIGGIYLKHQHIDQARILLQRAIRLAAQHLPPTDEDRLRVQQQLADVLMHDGHEDEAMVLLQETIAQWEKSDKKDVRILAACHLALGNASLKKGKPEAALKHAVAALQVCEKHFSMDDAETARCYLIFGLSRLELNQTLAARKDLQTAHNILVATLGEDHPDSVAARRALNRINSSTPQRKK